MLSPLMMLIKPALLSYRCAAASTSCDLAEAQMLPVLFTHFPAAYDPRGELWGAVSMLRRGDTGDQGKGARPRREELGIGGAVRAMKRQS